MSVEPDVAHIQRWLPTQAYRRADRDPGTRKIMALPQSFEPISNAIHLSIDMQNLFAPGGIWETSWMERVLPVIVAIAERNPPRTVFTRFITPLKAEDRPGRWQRFFTKWECATRSRLPSSQLEIVSPLSRLIPPAKIIDKPAYSAFAGSVLDAFLRERKRGDANYHGIGDGRLRACHRA
jgi:nicotinamidase-related amidase